MRVYILLIDTIMLSPKFNSTNLFLDVCNDKEWIKNEERIS